MIIVPTKKSLPLFSEFHVSNKPVKENEYSFYSWHANYFNIDRKKILVLVNDFSSSPIILADINAKNKKHLEDYIKEGIEQVFSLSTDKPYQIKKYFLMAGRQEISYAYNRSVISIGNNMIQMMKCYPENIDLNQRLQLTEMEFLARTPYKNAVAPYSISVETVKKELDKL